MLVTLENTSSELLSVLVLFSLGICKKDELLLREYLLAILSSAKVSL
jgi:hypothetical protein